MEVIFFLEIFKIVIELNQDVETFRNVLNPEMSIKLMDDESRIIESKLEFYKAIKKNGY